MNVNYFIEQKSISGIYERRDKFAAVTRERIKDIRLILAGGLVDMPVREFCRDHGIPLIFPSGGRYVFREVVPIIITVFDIIWTIY